MRLHVLFKRPKKARLFHYVLSSKSRCFVENTMHSVLMYIIVSQEPSGKVQFFVHVNSVMNQFSSELRQTIDCKSKVFVGHSRLHQTAVRAKKSRLSETDM